MDSVCLACHIKDISMRTSEEATRVLHEIRGGKVGKVHLVGATTMVICWRQERKELLEK